MAIVSQIKSFLGTMRLTLRNLLRGDNAIADYEDIESRREICHSCEFLTENSKKYSAVKPVAVISA